jgi:hypothetical protein
MFLEFGLVYLVCFSVSVEFFLLLVDDAFVIDLLLLRLVTLFGDRHCSSSGLGLCLKALLLSLCLLLSLVSDSLLLRLFMLVLRSLRIFS